MEILLRVLKLFAIAILSPVLFVAVVASILSLPIKYLITGEFEMIDFFGKTVDFLRL